MTPEKEVESLKNEMAIEHDINFSQVLQEGLKRELQIK